MTARSRRRVHVRGVVQGVGFRPFVYTTAAELTLSGVVSNDSSGVLVEIEGTPANLDEFVRRVRERPPPLAVVESVRHWTIPLRGGTGFHIADTTRDGVGRTLASPDVAMCADCDREPIARVITVDSAREPLEFDRRLRLVVHDLPDTGQR